MDDNQAQDSHFVIECILVIPVRVSSENIHINSAIIYERESVSSNIFKYKKIETNPSSENINI